MEDFRGSIALAGPAMAQASAQQVSATPCHNDRTIGQISQGAINRMQALSTAIKALEMQD
ncbi:hypothetical protein [Agrobacterium vitis]|uniref:hypothetical protein n=1 Tax=Agrobacterium vitis TaxID=373 RepID=UPI0018D208E1